MTNWNWQMILLPVIINVNVIYNTFYIYIYIQYQNSYVAVDFINFEYKKNIFIRKSLGL